jgi:G6PDH family F420-dependent oxidoreductase
MRIHPVVNAQAAATTAMLLGDRFTWGVGSGENLNEHILGDRWPPAEIRLSMLEEAIEVIRKLWTGESVTHRGRHYTVEDARLYDLPASPPPLLVSAFGPEAVDLAARAGDGLWSTGLKKEVVDRYRQAGGEGPIWTQLRVCWDPDPDLALQRAHDLWPVAPLPGQMSQDLRTVLDFEDAVTMVSVEDVAASFPCGPDPEPLLDAVREAADMGADHVYLHQVGDPLDGFLGFWEDEIRPKL